MKKFLLILFVVLVAAFVIFNYIAANVAENRIDEAIQQQADSLGLSVQYSSVDVAPFRGNVDFHDVTLVQQANIERAQQMHLDLRYLDFLNIYFGGVQYGLEQLNAGNIDFKKFSYINRGSMKQFSLARLHLKYHGNLWDALQTLSQQKPLAFRHQLDGTGSKLSYTKSTSAVGAFKSDSVFVHFNWPKATAQKQPTDSVSAKNIIWTPPVGFQQKYAFFIQGFGFKQDSIPVSTIGFSSTDFSQNRIKINNGLLNMELFTIHFNGNVINDSTWSNARLSPLHVTFTHLSQKFKNVLHNVEQLMGTTLPEDQNEISFQLQGPLTGPRIVQRN